MNKATSVLLSSILSTTVVSTSNKVYEDKYQTYMTNNLTQLEIMLDGWKSGYNDLNTKLINAESRIKILEDELAETKSQITELQNNVDEQTEVKDLDNINIMEEGEEVNDDISEDI